MWSSPSSHLVTIRSRDSTYGLLMKRELSLEPQSLCLVKKQLNSFKKRKMFALIYVLVFYALISRVFLSTRLPEQHLLRHPLKMKGRVWINESAKKLRGTSHRQSALDSVDGKEATTSMSAAGVTTQRLKKKLTQQSLVSVIGSAKIQFSYCAARGRHTQRAGITGKTALLSFCGS